MKRALIVLAALCLIVIGALAALPLFVSTQWVKQTVVDELNRATGLTIAIDGPVGLSAFPTLGLSLDSVRVRAPDGAEVMALERLRADLGLIALLSGNVRVNELVLDGLHVALLRQRDGAITLPGLVGGGADAEQQPEAEGDGLADLVAMLERLSVGSFEVRDGVAVIEDAASGVRETADQVALNFRLPSIDARAHADGNLRFRGQTIGFEAEIETPRALASSEPAAVMLDLNDGLVTGAVDGTVILADSVSFDGTVRLESDDLSEAIVWASGSPPGVELGALSFEAKAVMNPIAIALSDIRGEIAGTDFSGELTMPTASQVPTINGRIAAGEINLATLLPEADETPAAPSDGGGDAALDLSALSDFAADLTLTVKAVRGHGLLLRDLTARAVLGGGVLSLDIPEVGYDGGAIALSANARDDGGTAAVGGTVTASGIPLASVLAMAPIDYEASGRLNADVAFSARGATADTLIANASAEGHVGLTDGRISGLPLSEVVANDRTAGTLDDVDVRVGFAGTNQPVTLGGGATWRGERFSIDGTAGAPGTLLSGAPTKAVVELSSGRVSLGYDGTVTLAGTADGMVGLSTPSLRGLLAWLDTPIGEGDGLQAVSFSGRLNAGTDSVAVSDIRLKVDESTGGGSASVTLSGARPSVKADLAFERLDLTPYLSGGTSDAAPAQTPSGDTGWSREPLDLTALRAVDASVSLTTQTIVIDQIATGPATLGVTLEDGALDALLSRFELYSGSGTGRVNLADRNGATMKANFALDGLDIHRLLKDAAGFGALAGNGAIELAIEGAGNTTYALVDSLDGTASFKIANGAILGINIPKMVRNLTGSILSGWQSDPNEKTDFTAFGASFAISDGVATTSDLSLVGPLVRMTGAGNADLADKTLDFKVEPGVVASLEGQGSDTELKGLGVPVIIKGAWSDPKIYPDIQGILSNPQAALEQLKSVSGDFADLASLDQLGNTGALIGQIAGGDTKGAIGSLIDQQIGQISGNSSGVGGGNLQQALTSAIQQQVTGNRGNASGGGSGSAQDQIGSAIGQLVGGLSGQAAPPQPVETEPVAPAEAPPQSEPLPQPQQTTAPDTNQMVSGVVGGLIGQATGQAPDPATQQAVGNLVGGLLGGAAQRQGNQGGNAAAMLGGLFGGRPVQQQQPMPQAAAPQPASPQPVATTTVVPRPNPRR
ncbi:AsmA family protein [Amorphus sp. 3PC139-8]|uniref:AsmA family protein n=1 Tax=Amorphus sp. 3PC139-8 TaxID=2735676 RepID=UPI00345C77DD